MSLSIYQRIIADAFDSKNWNYSCKNLSEEKSMFSINFTSDVYGKTSCKVTIFDDGVCDIEAVLPMVCQKEQHMELCYYLASYNCLKRYATLRLDINDGEINNSYSYVFNKSTTPKDFLNRFLNVKDVDDSVLKDLISICNMNVPDKSSVVTTESQVASSGKNGKHKLVL